MVGAPKIPVSVIVATLDERARLGSCLSALGDFAEIVVVDSGSADGTAARAMELGARVETFRWSGAYPKKRQWCLDTLPLAHDWVFFIDADEIVTSALAGEIRALFAAGAPPHAGYFVRGRYVVNGRVLRHGLANNKLALFDRRACAFPVVDDLDLSGMGEMEGHYQPVFLRQAARPGQLRETLLHHAHDDPAAWLARHRRYATWEAGMNARRAWPRDPSPARQALKTLFRAVPCRGVVAFLHSYLLKGGWRDGSAGFRFALGRRRYYALIRASAASAGGRASARSRQ